MDTNKVSGEVFMHDVKIESCSEKSDEGCQNAFEYFEEGEFNFDALLEASGLNENVGAGSAMNPLLVMSDDEMPGEMKSGHAPETQAVEESLDFDLCAEQVEVWMARLKKAAWRKVEENHISNAMLQKKIEEQNQLIQQYESVWQMERQQKQHYELMLQKERQQKQTRDRKYERELYFMQSALEDYRNALKAMETSFAKYRERAQLPEEPLYMPHPEGGGNVILVSEWKKLEEERWKKRLSDIQALVEDFGDKWKSTF